MRKLVLAGVAAALALPAAAGGGGWATVGVAPLPPDGAGPGARWTPTLTVLQHGRTPLDGVQPVVTIRNPGTGATRSFRATPTGEPGQYRAEVVFPAEGSWAYAIEDGFSRTHTFAPIRIGAARADFPVSRGVAAAAALAGMLAAAFLLAGRRRRPAPALAGRLGD